MINLVTGVQASIVNACSQCMRKLAGGRSCEVCLPVMDGVELAWRLKGGGD